MFHCVKIVLIVFEYGLLKSLLSQEAQGEE
jgi:hypothetical protein